MRLSIVVPVLNEEKELLHCLRPLQALRQRGAEVILVDGGSDDATIAVGLPWVDQVVEAGIAQRGRARQMNCGASKASGDILLFLHADSSVPPDADKLIFASIDQGNFWGRFDVNITGRHKMLPVIAAFMNTRSRLTGIATGDQGIFITKAHFERIGGFLPQPLMEDVELTTRLRRLSRPACLRPRIVTSGRRWERHGVWRTILLMWILRLRYFFGATPESLHRHYDEK